MEVVELKIGTAKNFVDSKVGIKEQEAIQAAMPVNTGTKEGISVAVSTNIDSQGEGAGKRDPQADKKRLMSLIDDTNNKLKSIRRRCEYSYNEDVHRVAIKVIDSDTDKVIKEIPPEEALEAIQKIREVAGLLVDEKR
jgi:flagellar protein FlaG